MVGIPYHAYGILKTFKFDTRVFFFPPSPQILLVLNKRLNSIPLDYLITFCQFELGFREIHKIQMLLLESSISRGPAMLLFSLQLGHVSCQHGTLSLSCFKHTYRTFCTGTCKQKMLNEYLQIET